MKTELYEEEKKSLREIFKSCTPGQPLCKVDVIVWLSLTKIVSCRPTNSDIGKVQGGGRGESDSDNPRGLKHIEAPTFPKVSWIH